MAFIDIKVTFNVGGDMSGNTFAKNGRGVQDFQRPQLHMQVQQIEKLQLSDKKQETQSLPYWGDPSWGPG